jgi:hypothetical protein
MGFLLKRSESCVFIYCRLRNEFRYRTEFGTGTFCLCLCLCLCVTVFRICDILVRIQMRIGILGSVRVPQTSVADPDPHVFRPPGSGSTSQRYGSGSGSGSFYHHAKIVRKTLIPTFYFVTLFEFLSLKNDVNVPSKSNKQKKLC